MASSLYETALSVNNDPQQAYNFSMTSFSPLQFKKVSDWPAYEPVVIGSHDSTLISSLVPDDLTATVVGTFLAALALLKQRSLY